MSNALAIAAVTTMLDYKITKAILSRISSSDLILDSVTAKPLDKARQKDDDKNQINIFLYQTVPNIIWRNQSLPDRVQPGETGQPPLALNLFYLITTYGKDNDDIEGQRLLGMAMQELHDDPEIRPQDIENAITSTSLSKTQRQLLIDSNLKNQISQIQIIPQELSVEEISKMWSTFQTPYRISAAYEVSVVLIESPIPVKAALPVLSIGLGDRDLAIQANLTPPLPTLEALTWPSQKLGKQPSITLGETLTLRGHDLDQLGKSLSVQLNHPLLDAPKQISVPSPVSSQSITVKLPTSEDAPGWVVGFYTICLRGNQAETNALSIAIAPEIQLPDNNPTPNPPAPRADDPSLVIECFPPVHAEQQVSLFLSSQEIPWKRKENSTEKLDKTSSLKFSLAGIKPGEYFVRLRVDGVDSQLIKLVDGKYTFGLKYTMK